MKRQRLCIRFGKEGDLRLISHRDLARTWERLFRRAELPLAMSEGFHPHPRMTFPSALALGIEGSDEVLEITLTSEQDAEQVCQKLAAFAPPGLTIRSVQVVDPQQPKVRIDYVTYEMQLPDDRLAAVQAKIDPILQSDSCPVHREGRATPLDLKDSLDELRLDNNRLVIRVRMTREAAVRPREILELLGIDDLEQEGFWLTRSEVHVCN